MIGFGEWRVHIGRRPARMGAEISIYRIDSDSRKVQLLSVEKGVLIGKTLDRGDTIEAPTFTIDDELELRGILAAFQAAGKGFDHAEIVKISQSSTYDAYRRKD